MKIEVQLDGDMERLYVLIALLAVVGLVISIVRMHI